MLVLGDSKAVSFRGVGFICCHKNAINYHRLRLWLRNEEKIRHSSTIIHTRGHKVSEMPVWSVFFFEDALASNLCKSSWVIANGPFYDYGFRTFAIGNYARLEIADYENIVNVKIVDYFSDNQQQFVINASRIEQILWCPCILTKYSHKFARHQWNGRLTSFNKKFCNPRSCDSCSQHEPQSWRRSRSD